jgi:hypothetical protein
VPLLIADGTGRLRERGVRGDGVGSVAGLRSFLGVDWGGE